MGSAFFAHLQIAIPEHKIKMANYDIKTKCPVITRPGPGFASQNQIKKYGFGNARQKPHGPVDLEMFERVVGFK